MAENVILLTYLKRGDITSLEQYLMSESRLPGPRANLELIAAFSALFKSPENVTAYWNVLEDWAAISVEQAGVNEPRSFLAYCAVQSLGPAYLVSPRHRLAIAGLLRNAANDARWRQREMAAMACQLMAEEQFSLVQEMFAAWLADATPLEKRAVLAALAHPPILKDAAVAGYALRVCGEIVDDLILQSPDTLREEDWKVLIQGLEYAPSVFAAYAPTQGFGMLESWARKHQPVLSKIVKSNLGKARISKPFPAEVHRIQRLLAGS